MSSADGIISLLDNYPEDSRAFRSVELKPNGKLRLIAKPNKPLRKWLRSMNKELGSCFGDWPSFMHGGIKKRSYVSCARQHVNKRCVVTIDIKDCFDSITEEQIAAVLQSKLSLEPEISKKLAHMVSFRGRLAQGFPTSNFICNLYLLDALGKLNEYFKKQNLSFGNYVDDIVVSGKINHPDETINEIAVGLSRIGLKMNKAKNKIMPSHKRQVVCNLLVNKRLSLTKALKRELYSQLAKGQMNEASLAGWLANLKTIDPVFAKKLHNFSLKIANRSSNVS